MCRLHGYEVDTARLLPYPFADLTVDDVAPDLIAGSFQLDLFQRISIQRWLI